MNADYKPIGTVLEIWRYPVKGMAGEKLDSAKMGWNGLAGDRRYALHRVGSRSGLPFASPRDTPSLIRYRPVFRNPEDIDHSAIDVYTPSGTALDLYDSRVLAELETPEGGCLQVLTLWRGAYDAAPLSAITTASITAVGAMIGKHLETARFRPNFVIETIDTRQYPEDKWVGDLLVFGDNAEAGRMRVNRKDLRCVVVNLNPATGEKDCDVLMEVVKNRKNFLGVYGSAERPGRVQVGDTVYLAKNR